MLAALLLCAGCAPTPSAAPSQPPAASAPSEASPTPEPEPAPVATGIHITASSVSVLLSDGSTGETFDYFEPVSGAVDGIRDAIGAEPAVEDHAGSYNHPPFTTYDWNGLVLKDPEGAAEEPFSGDWSIAVTASEVDGISVDTVEGVRVGDSAPALEAAFPDSWNRVECCGAPERTDFRLGAEPADATSEETAAYAGATFEGPFEFAVWLIAADPAATITEFRAPSPNCCGV